jgi:hypothetical protein
MDNRQLHKMKLPIFCSSMFHYLIIDYIIRSPMFFLGLIKVVSAWWMAFKKGICISICTCLQLQLVNSSCASSSCFWLHTDPTLAQLVFWNVRPTLKVEGKHFAWGWVWRVIKPLQNLLMKKRILWRRPNWFFYVAYIEAVFI